MSDEFGARFKDYESISTTLLPRKSWMIIRIDGKSFHSWTRHMERPYSSLLAHWMDETAKKLCQEIPCAELAYVQSDEISVVINPGGLHTDPWFNGKVQKIVSVSASIATAEFNHLSRTPKFAVFDSRVFVVPSPVEVVNYLIWRQRDAVRNSISMAAQSMFSDNRLHGVNSGRMQEMMFEEKKVNWNDYDPRFKRGGLVLKMGAMRNVMYTHKKTGGAHAVEAFRTWWESMASPHLTSVENWRPEEVPQVSKFPIIMSGASLPLAFTTK